MEKFINLEQDFDVDREIDKDAPPNNELTMHWIKSAIIAGYPQMTSDQRRMYANISRRMQKAFKEKSSWLPINQIELLFIKGAFDKGQTKAEFATAITIAENALLNAVDKIPEGTNPDGKTLNPPGVPTSQVGTIAGIAKKE